MDSHKPPSVATVIQLFISCVASLASEAPNQQHPATQPPAPLQIRAHTCADCLANWSSLGLAESSFILSIADHTLTKIATVRLLSSVCDL